MLFSRFLYEKCLIGTKIRCETLLICVFFCISYKTSQIYSFLYDFESMLLQKLDVTTKARFFLIFPDFCSVSRFLFEKCEKAYFDQHTQHTANTGQNVQQKTIVQDYTAFCIVLPLKFQNG